jgi:hypothetical protein
LYVFAFSFAISVPEERFLFRQIESRLELLMPAPLSSDVIVTPHPTL